MKKIKKITLLNMLILGIFGILSGQAPSFVDEQGVWRWTESGEEVCAFGVNYSEPFSSWRQHEMLGVRHEKAIDADVYHLARMGLDGYRIHVWETYISDFDGNLIYNKHLQLFDYLLSKLKERNIKIFLTPMNFYGGSRSGFINKYGGKRGCLTDTASFPAQENYLAQFVSHVNPYTGVAYKDDPDIVGFEINNEPFNHGDRPDLTTYYINRMTAAIRSTGCEKPIFYNVTHNIDQIGNFCADDIAGGTFQWYPTGLVANHDQKGNVLPNVDRYPIPFADHPSFRDKAKAVYELSPADVASSSHLYPVMARSFREAGVQFAAQFAYDPMHVADVNFEYKTHYVSLPYAPKKSMGMVIAAEVFHRVPLGKSYGRYPDNTSFDVFRVSYQDDLAEMVTEEKFLYTNHTPTRPPKPEKLVKVAGTGISPVVDYKGTGVYFLDRLEPGVWRLEVMPDAVWVGDPHFSTALDKQVSVIQWREWPMSVRLPDLGEGFKIEGLNDGNETELTAEASTFSVSPGAYLLSRRGVTSTWGRDDTLGSIVLHEFVAPESHCKKTYVVHDPPGEISAGSSLTISARIVSPEKSGPVELVMVNPGRRQAIPMKETKAYTYTAEVPEVYLESSGILDYYITIGHGNEYETFPGSIRSDHPLSRGTGRNDRKFHEAEPYSIRIMDPGDPVCLFDAGEDIDNITKPQRERQYGIVPSPLTGKSMMIVDVETLEKRGQNADMTNQTVVGDHSLRTYCRDRVTSRMEDLTAKDELVLYGHALNDKNCKLQLAMLMRDGTAYGGVLNVGTEPAMYRFALEDLALVRTVLLPRAYPTFLPYWFEMATPSEFDISEVESIQISIGPGIPENNYGQPHGVAIGRILLQ